jgi:hypothetical protein
MAVRTSAIISYQTEDTLIIDSNDELPDSIDMPNLKRIFYRNYNIHPLPYHPTVVNIIIESYAKLPDPKNVPNLQCLELNCSRCSFDHTRFPVYPNVTTLRIFNGYDRTTLPNPINVPKLEYLSYFVHTFEDTYRQGSIFFIPNYKNLKRIICNAPFKTNYLMYLKNIDIRNVPACDEYVIVNGYRHKPKFLLELGAKLILVNLSRHIKEKYILAEMIKPHNVFYYSTKN